MMVDRVLYTQLCFTTFEDGNLRNAYIPSNVKVDPMNNIDSSRPGLGNPI
jgi:hypothetical protein